MQQPRPVHVQEKTAESTRALPQWVIGSSGKGVFIVVRDILSPISRPQVRGSVVLLRSTNTNHPAGTLQTDWARMIEASQERAFVDKTDLRSTMLSRVWYALQEQ
ncbi:hypothetical protein PG993_001004 [Apiospora rasikravindrae]|uniref:Uncharacterized protein n=1 Tax=Apiospora rasikravindrae TaxID=990691 RepID=A0ABR1UAP3_9PEZI